MNNYIVEVPEGLVGVPVGWFTPPIGGSGIGGVGTVGFCVGVGIGGSCVGSGIGGFIPGVDIGGVTGIDGAGGGVVGMAGSGIPPGVVGAGGV